MPERASADRRELFWGDMAKRSEKTGEAGLRSWSGSHAALTWADSHERDGLFDSVMGTVSSLSIWMARLLRDARSEDLG